MGIPYHEIRQWPAVEISLYQAYYRLEPFGDQRADLRMANQMQLLANLHGNKVGIEDCMFKFEKTEPESLNTDALKKKFSQASRVKK